VTPAVSATIATTVTIAIIGLCRFHSDVEMGKIDRQGRRGQCDCANGFQGDRDEAFVQFGCNVGHFLFLGIRLVCSFGTTTPLPFEFFPNKIFKIIGKKFASRGVICFARTIRVAMQNKKPTSGTEIKQELAEMLPRILRFASSLTRDVSHAEDLVQTAYIKAVEHIDQYQHGTRLDSWLFRIVQNTWIDEKRRQQRTGKVVSIDDARDGTLPAQMPTNSDRVFLQTALETLPEDQRAALSLVLVEGYTYREAGDILGIPDGTVMSRVSRARQHLVTLYDTGGNFTETATQRGSSR
jgi:RNA polymerase sigma-70 factor (ECF subfamily)